MAGAPPLMANTYYIINETAIHPASFNPLMQGDALRVWMNLRSPYMGHGHSL